jgi:WD40 repeat protein
MSASDDGNIILTNLVSYRQEILPRSSEHEIKKLVCLADHNCLVACDSWGKVIFYSIGENSRFRNKLLFSMDYQTISLTKKSEVFPVTAIDFDRYNKLLLLGDEFGNVEGWDLSELLKLIDECKIEEKKKKRRRDHEKE